MDVSADPGEQVPQLEEIDARTDALDAEYRRSKEADDAGVTAYKVLDSAASMFRSAKAFSTMDLFGGGLLAGALKYSQLGKTRTQLHRADRALRVFAGLLEAAKVEGVEGPHISGGLKVADLAFDNVFSDWTVQGRITRARSRVRKTQKKVHAIVTGLRDRRKEITAELAALESERDKLLTG